VVARDDLNEGLLVAVQQPLQQLAVVHVATIPAIARLSNSL
jgi:hypothetical protein